MSVSIFKENYHLKSNFLSTVSLGAPRVGHDMENANSINPFLAFNTSVNPLF